MSVASRRVGIFGGSFDPVHNAHIALARQALVQLALDEVVWVPAGHPWQKRRAPAPAHHREAMVALAVENEPGFTLSRLELDRDGPSFTVDTVRELRAQRPGINWHLLIGQDQFAALHTWHGWQALTTLATLAVANRTTNDGTVPPGGDPRVLRLPHETIALPAMTVSSTGIRARLALGLGIDDLVPAAVARYIARHHLYQDQPPPRS